MKKTKITVSLSAIMLCAFLGNTPTASAATDSNYKPDVATRYAENWALSYNTKEYYKADYDCTNFVSQCLEKGGKKRSSSLPSYTDTKYWRPHSATWENANYFKKYWVTKVASTGKSISGMTTSQKSSYALSVINKVSLGDVVQYGYGSDNMKHSQIVYKGLNGPYGYHSFYMAQHTSGSKTIDLHNYIRDTNYTYVRYYNMKTLK